MTSLSIVAKAWYNKLATVLCNRASFTGYMDKGFSYGGGLILLSMHFALCFICNHLLLYELTV